MANEEKTEKAIDTKKLLKDLGSKETKMRYTDRKKVEVLKDTKHYRKGQIIAPHVTFADALIENKIAKEVKQ